MLEAYGHMCACCGITEANFLTVDHSLNDGTQHRREIGGSSNKLYKWLKRNGYPKDRFRLLCWNCNCSRQFYGQCPHEKARESAG